ncbi:MAG: hypothetical protein OXC10_20960 [Rhodospirillaceae bacterium]|nr:hypothetical protein [Rhodospirillaceae bacterium]
MARRKVQTGAKAALAEIAAADPAAFEAEPALIPAEPADLAGDRAPAKRGPGRPKGARAKRTAHLAAEIGGRFGHPVIALAERYAFADLAEIARRASVTPSRAAELQIDALDRLAAWVTPRPKPGAPPSVLALALADLMAAQRALIEERRAEAAARRQAAEAMAAAAVAGATGGRPSPVEAGPAGDRAADPAADPVRRQDAARATPAAFDWRGYDPDSGADGGADL